MSEEESSSVFGGIAEAAGSAWDAAGEVIDAEVSAVQGAGNFAAGAADNLVSGVAQMTGDYATRDEYDKAYWDRMAASEQSFSDAGDHLSQAGTDIVGE